MKTLKPLIIIFISFLITSFSFASWWTLWGDNLWDLFATLHKLLEYIYLILWPLMFLAWKFLSNNFIYGSAFGIDNVLWQLWQVVRWFTNYIIWFIFIASIFIYFFKADSKFSFKKILPRIVIASIFVNMSWFLIAALVDISTVLTLEAGSIWSALNNSGKQSDKEQELQKKNIMVPLTIDTDNTNNFITINWNNWSWYHACMKDKDKKILNAPCISFKDSNFVILNKSWEPDKKLTKSIWWLQSKKSSWDALWMLVSLFRYMNGAFLVDNTNNKVNLVFLDIIKFLLLLVLIIPFIILTIILVVRLVLLWVIIPLSPFILWAYILWIFDSEIKKRFKDIITLIFQPAYIVFMLSIWFVFIQSIHTMMPNNENKKDVKKKLEALWIYEWKTEKEGKWQVKTINIWKDWVFVIQSKYTPGKGLNDSPTDYKNILSYIPWLIANLLSAFVLWSLVFIAFKSNSITWKIAEPIDNFAKTWLKTVPILPWGNSVESLWQTLHNIWRIPSNKVQTQTSELGNEFKKKDDTSSWSST